ncbi:MAG: hypothetical protein ACXQTV_02510 [Candidatus Hecatellaceae archaeon]
MPIFAVEHLEAELGRWLLIEYLHGAELVKPYRLLITNVRKAEDRETLRAMGLNVEGVRVFELFNPRRLLILDPQAEGLLQPSDFKGVEVVVVGGILGDHPPRGRTKRFLASLCPEAKVRSLGKLQFTIDGALFMARRVYEGFRLEEIPTVEGFSLRVSSSHEIYLPYGYPLVGGKPLISPRLVEYLLESGEA